MAERYYNALELAGLPGLPSTRDNVVKRATRESWPSRPRAGRGGGREYPLSCLPEATRAAILSKLTEEAASRLPARMPQVEILPALPASAPQKALLPGKRGIPNLLYNPEELRGWQQKRAEARLAILSLCDQLTPALGADGAISKVLELAERGELPPHIQTLIPVANARAGAPGKQRTISKRTIFRWKAALSKGENAVTAVAPRPIERVRIPAWAPTLLALYRMPQKPRLAEAVALLPQHLPTEIPVPNYHAVRRFLQKCNIVDIQRGRMGPRELRKIRMYISRDFSMLLPTDIYMADGHTFDAAVAHPTTGKPFRPEHTEVIDVVTRRIVGWSVGLAESTWTVLDALRHGVETAGIPAIFYVDNGSGYKNALMNDLSTGFMARLGIGMRHSIPYNSQARGVIERVHQTVWVKLARTYATFQGHEMDAQTRKTVDKEIKTALAVAGTSRNLISWREHLVRCTEAVEAYNNTPHSSLPKIRDPRTGVLRHETPNEVWARYLTAGFAPIMASEIEARDCFRPYESRVTRRGIVAVSTNTYSHKALEAWHGQTVQVGYDIHDPSRVWIRDQEGMFICIAAFEGNKRAFFAVPAVEKHRADRLSAQEKRIEKNLGLIEEERRALNGTVDVEYQELTPEEEEKAARALAAMEDSYVAETADSDAPMEGASDISSEN